MYGRQHYHVVIDMLNDFISGPMTCLNAENALNHSVNYINMHPADAVLYVCDAHPANHCSFTCNGGQWPVHCVKNTLGQEIHLAYYTRINEPSLRPHFMRIFGKGQDPDEEQYSGFNARCADGKYLYEAIPKGMNNEDKTVVVLSGTATEYCVQATAKDLVEAGYDVQVVLEALAYVNLKDHRAAVENMKSIGIKFI